MAHFRIYKGTGTAFQVRVWRWWWPFWVAPRDNESETIEGAEAWARGYAGVPPRCVKSLGPL